MRHCQARPDRRRSGRWCPASPFSFRDPPGLGRRLAPPQESKVAELSDDVKGIAQSNRLPPPRASRTGERGVREGVRSRRERCAGQLERDRGADAGLEGMISAVDSVYVSRIGAGPGVAEFAVDLY